MSTRIAILGGGRLGESMLRGFLSSGWRAPGDLVVTARRQERLAALHEKYGVVAEASNVAAIQGAGLVIVAVKPQDMEAVLEEMSGEFTPNLPFPSLSVGVPSGSIEAHLPPGARVVREMPTAPALVHEEI